MNREAISLYRQSLRTIRDIPLPGLRQKMQYNVRELFSIYKAEPEHKVAEVIADGRNVLKLLQEILNGRKDAVLNLFKSFENINSLSSESDSKQQILPL
jgi:hypothetical protein